MAALLGAKRIKSSLNCGRGQENGQAEKAKAWLRVSKTVVNSTNKQDGQRERKSALELS